MVVGLGLNMSILGPRKLCLLLTILGLSLSCMKEPKFAEDEGTPVNPEELQTKFIEARGDFDPFKIRLNEFSEQEKTFQISTLQSKPTLQKGVTVSEIVDLGTELEFHITIQAKEFLDNNQMKPSTRQRIARATKPTAPSTTMATTALHQNVLKSLAAVQTQAVPLQAKSTVHAMVDETEIAQLGYELFANLLNVCNPPSESMVQQGITGIECFNLKAEKVLEPVPEYVKTQPNCQGFVNCNINVTKIEFYVIYTEYDSETKITTRSKVMYNIKLSSEAPFFSKLLDFCYTGVATAENQQFPVTFCTKTINFKFGDVTP